jgi:hypothetical protein
MLDVLVLPSRDPLSNVALDLLNLGELFENIRLKLSLTFI